MTCEVLFGARRRARARRRCVPRRVSAKAKARRLAALSTLGGLGRYWAAQWHLARAVGKRFRGCRAHEKNTKAAGRRRRAAAVAGRGRRPPPQGGRGCRVAAGRNPALGLSPPYNPFDQRCWKKSARDGEVVWLEELVELLGGMQVASACSSRSLGDISGSSAQTPASKRTGVGEEPTPLTPPRVPRKGEEDAPSARTARGFKSPTLAFD